MEKNELSCLIKNNIVAVNNEAVRLSKQHGYTVLGDIAIALENNNQMIMDCADVFSKYIATNKNYKLAKRYEEESNIFEKVVRNNQNRLEHLRAEQEFNNHLIVNGIRFATEGGLSIVKRVLDYLDNAKMKESAWKMCVVYAGSITNWNYVKYPGVEACLRHISNSLFKNIKDINQVNLSDWDADLVLPNNNNYKNVAFLLYMLYSQKHLQEEDSESILKDILTLYIMWERIGIYNKEAKDLFSKFKEIDITVGYDFVNTNIIYRGIVNNLSISMAPSNDRLVRQLNRECLKYVPNSTSQGTTKLLGKTAICVGIGITGIKTGNPFLIQSATTSALSLFSNLDNSDIIGNSLSELGIDENIIRECIQEAKAKKDKNKVVINV